MTRSSMCLIAAAVVLLAVGAGGCAEPTSTGAKPRMLYQPYGYPMFYYPPGVTPVSFAEAPYTPSRAIPRPYVIGRGADVQEPSD